MAIVPFRGLSQKGILYDPSPFQLDLNAWSDGSNVRFHGNKVMRSPGWRAVYAGLPAAPRYCFGRRPSTGEDQLFIVGVDGNVYSYASSTVLQATASGTTLGVSDASFTSSFSGDVSYINSPASVPLYYGPASTNFATLPGWDATWTAASLRAFSDYVVALNVTKGPVSTPNLVKWSDLTLDGQPPASWDADDPTTSAGENPLEDLDTPIVDGLPMRSIFVIYSQNQIWGMTPSGDTFIFDFQRLFSEGGLISQNCVVEVDGRHYVFGPNDIYVHDGVSKQSICDGRNRDYVFRNLDTKNAQACFALYMPALNEIMFAYPSNSGTEYFTDVSGSYCNRAAIYSITGDTWSFIDLPNVPAATLVNIDNILTYATAPATTTYANVGGSYFDQQNGYSQSVVAISQPLSGAGVTNPISTSRLLAYDFITKGRLPYPFEPECNGTSYIQKTGMDLEQVGSDLHTYKHVRRMFPLVSIFAQTPLNIQVGAQDTPYGLVTYGNPVTFDPTVQYKVDCRIGSRFIAVQFNELVPVDYEIEGWDFDVVPGGTR